MTVIDIGVNFHSRQLLEHIPALLERARESGVQAILATGTSVASSQLALTLAGLHPGFVYATAGLHPHVADQGSQAAINELAWMLRRPEVVAVGECGLDYNRDFSSRSNQRLAFEAQLALAIGIKKPLFLHCRDAFEDFHAMVKPAVAAGAHGVVHCFTGDTQDAESLLELGLDIGITGWVTDLARGQALREAVAKIPLERMHLETDAPYLAPKNLKKRRPFNEPANVWWVARAVGELLGLEPEEVARVCAENSRRLFGLDENAAGKLTLSPSGA